MADPIRITPRPQLNTQQASPQLQVTAQQHDYLGALPAPDAELSGLIKGLSMFNQSLAQYDQQQEHQQRYEGALAGKAAAQNVQAPREALTGQPIEAPVGAPPAYAAQFVPAMKEGLAQRAAVQLKTEAVSEYDNLKDTPDFNVQQWLQQKRAAALQGITDPHMAAVIGQHFTELEGHIGAEAERQRLIQRDEIRASTMTQIAADMFTADMSPDKISQAYPLFLERAKSIGYTPKESAQILFQRVAHMSNQLGGSPELFDVFDRKDPEGMNLLARNPQLAPHIDEAKRQAMHQRDQAIKDAAEKGNAVTLMGYESDIDNAPEKVTMERILGDMSKYGPVQSAEKAASLWNRAQDALRKKAATMQLMALYDSGELWRLDPGQQGKVLDLKIGPLVENLAQATRSGDSQAVSLVASQIMQAHSRSGATVPVDQLQRYIETTVSNLPNPEGPDAKFQAASELYKALSADPKYRDIYFKDDTRKVMETYTDSVKSGSDPKSSYMAAYRAVSPEAKAAAEKYTSTPEFTKKLQATLQKYAEGSSWVPRIFGGNGRPEATAAIAADALPALRSYLVKNPYASDKEVQSFVEDYAQKNYAQDTTTNQLVKVPPAMAGKAASDALSAYSKRLTDALQLNERSDGHWEVRYAPTGTEGQYEVRLWNGMQTSSRGIVNLQTLIDTEAANRVLTDSEKASLGQWRQAYRNGQPVPAVDPALLAKAEAIHALNGDEAQAIRNTVNKQFMDRLGQLPTISLGAPSFDNLQFIPGRSGQLDNQMTAKAASGFLSGPSMGPAGDPQFNHVGPALSLITMGEGMALRAYQDPAKGAGMNIGMGYNLKANEGNVDSDLKRAGVPEEALQAVKDGRASLTPDQAKRLLQVAMPRYEKQAKDAAEASSPGLWSRMTPAQRAVMVDVAYQVGDVSRFKKAWSALAAGDMKAFQEETKVTYVDSSGTRREDTRRNNLRAAMLAGMSTWQSAVQKFGTLPSSKLQALASTQ